MKASYQLEATFNSSLEHAFRTPIHGDATKILRGFGPIPPCIGFEEDGTWGREGGTRIPILKKTWLIKGGRTGIDKVTARDDNEYWRWQVTDFGTWTMFFTTKAQGEWWIVEENEEGIRVRWRYTYSARSIFTQPMNWLFVKVLWRVIMNRGMGYIKEMAERGEPFLYD